MGDDMTVVEFIHEHYPERLDALHILAHAMHITTVLGDGQAASNDGQPSAFWYPEGDYDNWICFLCNRGVYFSDDMEAEDQYRIIGYCVVQNVPYFTDTTILRKQHDLQKAA